MNVRFAVLAALALTVGCSNPAGQVCNAITSPCPDGYLCTGVLNSEPRCLTRCDRRSDCNAPAACIPFPSSTHTGLCTDVGGPNQLGELCEMGTSTIDSCDRGLTCGGTPLRCVPACNALRPSAWRECGLE